MALSEGGPPELGRELSRRLRRFQARLWLEQVLRWSVRGLCLGLALALGGALALVAQQGLVERGVLLTLALAGLGAGLLYGLVRPPNLGRVARAVDARLGLASRLCTAVELARKPNPGRFAPAQLADARRAALGARLSWSTPLASSWREGLLAALLVVAVLATLRLEGAGPALLTRLPAPAAEAPPAGDDRSVLAPAEQAAAAQGPQAAARARQADPALRALDELRQARASGAMSGEQASAELDRLEQQLSQQAAEARRQREPLDRLARALGQVSAGEAAAERIQEGDFDRAGEELNSLARESDQLSREARSQLAQALRQAAAESAASPALADRERQAAEALAGKEYAETESALRALGEQVAQAGQQTAGQEALAEAMRQVEQERAASGQPAAGQGERSAVAAGQSGQQSAAGGSQAGDGEGLGLESAGSGQVEGPAAQANQGAQPQDGPADASQPAPLGSGAPRLDVAGKQVEVPARPGSSPERGPRVDQPGEQEQVVGGSQQTFESDRPAATVQSAGQAERVLIPGDQRQVVRDYFARRGGRGAP